MKYCLRQREIPKGERGLRLYFIVFIVYSHSQFLLLANIFSYWPRELAIPENIRPAEDLGVAPRKYSLSGRVYCYRFFSVFNR